MTMEAAIGRGRRRLGGGFSVWLPDHRSEAGVIYRRYLKAGLELVGVPASARTPRGLPFGGSELLRVEVERYARAAVLHDQAAKHWAQLLYQRQHGKGRRPNERRIERAARRVGLAEGTLKEITQRLEELAAKRASTHGALAAQYGGATT
jgi:hypothetical protein